MVDIQSPTAENRRGKTERTRMKEERKMKPQLQKYYCLPYWVAILTRVKYGGLRYR